MVRKLRKLCINRWGDMFKHWMSRVMLCFSKSYVHNPLWSHVSLQAELVARCVFRVDYRQQSQHVAWTWLCKWNIYMFFFEKIIHEWMKINDFPACVFLPNGQFSGFVSWWILGPLLKLQLLVGYRDPKKIDTWLGKGRCSLSIFFDSLWILVGVIYQFFSQPVQRRHKQYKLSTAQSKPKPSRLKMWGIQM